METHIFIYYIALLDEIIFFYIKQYFYSFLRSSLDSLRALGNTKESGELNKLRWLNMKQKFKLQTLCLNHEVLITKQLKLLNDKISVWTDAHHTIMLLPFLNAKFPSLKLFPVFFNFQT